jgi:gamma-glutamyltranspeptidase/glutathione hydrolase
MMQPQGHVQVIVRIADYGQNPQAACDGPRFRWLEGLQVCVENGFPPATLDGLRDRGHRLAMVDDYNQFGSCQAIWRLGAGAGNGAGNCPGDGPGAGYVVASDPRRDGQAVGF